METIDALQAIERGDKIDQNTLRSLNQAQLINLSSVSHVNSLNPELVFAGFTPQGLRLLKEQKSSLVSDLERQLINMIVRGFLDRNEATPKKALLKQFRSAVSEELHRLSNRGVLNLANNTYPNETYLPKTLAFYHCGDPAALAFARKWTQMVLQVLPTLFGRQLEADGDTQKQFTPEDVLNEIKAIDSSVEPDAIFTGLYLAQEFSVFSSLRTDEQRVGIVSFSLGERVFEKRYLNWDEHIRRGNMGLIHDAEMESSDFFQGATPNRLEAIPAIESEEPLALLIHETEASRRVFVVHGHADEPKHAVASFLRSGGLEPIILHEQPNEGKTIVEKFEKHSDVVGFAVVLLTPDDIGASAAHPANMRPRARQNVVLELGYFMGKLGRGKVCCLYVDGVELPSDYQGVLWLPYDDSGAWRDQLAKELSAAGIELKPETAPTAVDGQWTTKWGSIKDRLREV